VDREIRDEIRKELEKRGITSDSITEIQFDFVKDKGDYWKVSLGNFEELRIEKEVEEDDDRAE